MYKSVHISSEAIATFFLSGEAIATLPVSAVKICQL